MILIGVSIAKRSPSVLAMGKLEIGIAAGVILVWLAVSKIARVMGWTRKSKGGEKERIEGERPRRRLPLR